MRAGPGCPGRSGLSSERARVRGGRWRDERRGRQRRPPGLRAGAPGRGRGAGRGGGACLRRGEESGTGWGRWSLGVAARSLGPWRPSPGSHGDRWPISNDRAPSLGASRLPAARSGASLQDSGSGWTLAAHRRLHPERACPWGRNRRGCLAGVSAGKSEFGVETNKGALGRSPPTKGKESSLP